MMRGLASWFAALSRREQAMVAIAGLLLAGVLVWLLLIRPIASGLPAARENFYQATLASGRISAKLDRLNVAKDTNRVAYSGGVPIGTMVASDAGERGFTLDRNDPRGEGSIDIAIGSARPAAITAWLAELEARGVSVEALSIQPGADGNVAVTATLRAVQGGAAVPLPPAEVDEGSAQ